MEVHDDPLSHIKSTTQMLDEIIEQAHGNVLKFHEPPAQATFETMAGLTGGIRITYSPFDENSCDGMRR